MPGNGDFMRTPSAGKSSSRSSLRFTAGPQSVKGSQVRGRHLLDIPERLGSHGRCDITLRRPTTGHSGTPGEHLMPAGEREKRLEELGYPLERGPKEGTVIDLLSVVGDVVFASGQVPFD